MPPQLDQNNFEYLTAKATNLVFNLYQGMTESHHGLLNANGACGAASELKNTVDLMVHWVGVISELDLYIPDSLTGHGLTTGQIVDVIPEF